MNITVALVTGYEKASSGPFRVDFGVKDVVGSGLSPNSLF